jgi:hypothetical protein
MLTAMLTTVVLAAGSVPPDTVCIWNQSSLPGQGVITMPDARRTSPRDSLAFQAGGAVVKVCYSRPSSRGRTMIGGTSVPYGKVWRTGANEATMIHTTGHLVVAGIHLDAGTYSLYTVPGEREWEVIINRSYMQWGHESTYTDSVRAQEVGRGRVPAQHVDQAIEQFTMRAERQADGDANLILEWEHSRVAIPFRRMR